MRSWNECLVGGEVPTLACLEVLASRIVFISSWVILIALFVMILVGAYHYLTAFGSEEKMKKAQDTLKFAFIGLFIYFSAFLIIRIIGLLFLENPEQLWKLNLFE